MSNLSIREMFEKALNHPSKIFTDMLRNEGKSDREIEEAVCELYELEENAPERAYVKEIVAASAKLYKLKDEVDVPELIEKLEEDGL